MDKQEVKEESKGQSLPAEVRSAQRRRAMQMSRARMMDAVPEADVVVTNPTHFSVALKYDDGMLAPEVVAKGQDLIALKIREIAREHGVPGRAQPAARPRPVRLRRGRPGASPRSSSTPWRRSSRSSTASRTGRCAA